jgi:hypothetical protein
MVSLVVNPSPNACFNSGKAYELAPAKMSGTFVIPPSTFAMRSDETMIFAISWRTFSISGFTEGDIGCSNERCTLPAAVIVRGIPQLYLAMSEKSPLQ